MEGVGGSESWSGTTRTELGLGRFWCDLVTLSHNFLSLQHQHHFVPVAGPLDNPTPAMLAQRRMFSTTGTQPTSTSEPSLFEWCSFLKGKFRTHSLWVLWFTQL